MKVIALSGYKFSGKDTIANYLIETYGYVRTSFADPLKDAVSEEFGIPRESMDLPEMKERPILSMPVNPQDDFSRMIAEFMIKEFRTITGSRPESYTYESGQFMGRTTDPTGLYPHLVEVFYTPRALCILKGSTNRSVKSNFWVQKAIESVWAKHADGHEFHVISDLRYQSEMQQLEQAFDNIVFVRINRFKDSPSQDPSERDLDNARFDRYIDNTESLDKALAQAADIHLTGFEIKKAGA